MKALKIVAVAATLLAVLGFAGYHAYLYSLGLYATEPVYQTSAGAIGGYDPVAYFTDGKPVAGKAEFTHAWNGATWHFASAENLERFKLNPEGYAPQFGGYCAYAVGHNYTANSDPTIWHIDGGKLYLNFNAEVREAWLGKKVDLIASGAKNWPAVIQD